MKKKILIGSIIVVVLLLLMPSIPAIQTKTIEEGFKQDLYEKLGANNLDELLEIEMLDGIKHPSLYEIVVYLLLFRLQRAYKLSEISIEDFGNDFRIKRPLLYLRCQWLFTITGLIAIFWNCISDTLGWNWPDLVDIIILFKPKV